LKTMNQEQRKSRLTKCLSRLEPSFQHLSVFTSAINNCVQAKAEPVALIWGVCLGVLTVSD
jgi:hypothetical protein